MIEKLNQKLNQFYHFSFIFLMMATLGTIFYFWKLGFVDGSRNKELHKAHYILDQYENNKPLNEVKSIVFSENSKLAISKLESIENDLFKVNNLAEDADFNPVKEEIQHLKTAIANLISFPKVSKIISVFNEKLIKFNQYVEFKNWRTLTRTSSRILEQTQTQLNKKKLRSLVESIEKDFSYMKKVTENSFIPRQDRSEIESRINNLQIETKMLAKYVEERNALFSTLEGFEKNLQSWISKVSPQLSYQRIQVEQMGRFYTMGLLGILVLTSMLFFGSFAFSRWHRNKAQQNIEKFVEEYVTDGLINGKIIDLKTFSQNFQHFSDHTADYIEKRMSYGSIFQEALPLSSVMLDKNLKVIWANKQFCEDWLVAEDEINKDYLSWDYLSKLTNIGDDDPVMEALKHRVAGIYQIQVKPSENAEVRPYEMFVSPVRFKHETRIMLFFYPLMSLQETISMQARSIVNPIEKILEMIIQGQFNPEERKQLQKEFEIADILPLLEKFEMAVAKQEEFKNRMLDKIEMLYGKLDKVFDITDDIENSNTETSEINTLQVKNLKSFKENVIALSSSAKELEKTSQDEFQSLKETYSAFTSSTQKVELLKDLVEKVLVAIPKFGDLRVDLKDHKGQLAETKMRFSHSLAQMVHIKKQIADQDVLARFSNSYDRVNTEFKKLDEVSISLDKRLTHLEVLLSKTQMLVDDIAAKAPNLDATSENKVLVSVGEKMTIYQNTLLGLDQRIEQTEDHVISNLKSMYINTKNLIEQNRNVTQALGKRPNMVESIEPSVKVEKSETSLPASGPEQIS